MSAGPIAAIAGARPVVHGMFKRESLADGVSTPEDVDQMFVVSPGLHQDRFGRLDGVGDLGEFGCGHGTSLFCNHFTIRARPPTVPATTR